jgi:phosphomannomutase
MLHILSTSNKTLSQLVKGLNSPYYSIDELNLTVKDTKAVISKIKETLSDGVQDNLDGLTIEYPDWWCNVRASNTEPVLRLNIEANSKQLLADKTKQLSAMIKT